MDTTTRPYTRSKTLQNFSLRFDVFIPNIEVSKKFEGFTKHFVFIHNTDGTIRNDILQVKDKLKVDVSWEPVGDEKFKLMAKHDATLRAIKSRFGVYITEKMNALYREGFNPSRIKIAHYKPFEVGVQCDICYSGVHFATIVRIEEYLQKDIF